MARSLLAILILLPGGYPPAPLQDSEPFSFAELIERTNGCGAFTATYEIEGPMAGIMELAYQAPDQVFVAMRSDESEMAMWCVGGVLHLRASGEEHVALDLSLREIEYRYEAITKAWNARFPTMTVDCEWTTGPFITITFENGSEAVPWETRLALGYTNCRNVLFGWLPWLENRATIVSDRGDHIGLAIDPGLAVRLSRATGLLELVELEADGTTTAVLRLIEHEADAAIPQETFVVPPPAAGAVDGLASASSFARISFEPRIQSVYRRAGRALADGRLDWNDSTRESLHEVFLLAHGLAIEDAWTEWVEGTRERIDRFADWVGKAERFASAETLAERVTEFRDGLHEALDGAVESYLGSVDRSKHASSDDPNEERIFAVEREAAEDAFEDTVNEPLRRKLDEELRELGYE